MAGTYSSKKEMEFQGQLASVAIAVEALESILVQKGILQKGELQERIVKLTQRKVVEAVMFREAAADFWNFVPVKLDG